MGKMFESLALRVGTKNAGILRRLDEEHKEEVRKRTEAQRRKAEREQRERKEIITSLLSHGVPREKFRFLGSNEDDAVITTNSFQLFIGESGIKAQVLIGWGDNWIVDEMNTWDRRYRRFVGKGTPSKELSVSERIERLFSIIEEYPTYMEVTDDIIKNIRQYDKNGS